MKRCQRRLIDEPRAAVHFEAVMNSFTHIRLVHRCHTLLSMKMWPSPGIIVMFVSVANMMVDCEYFSRSGCELQRFERVEFSDWL